MNQPIRPHQVQGKMRELLRVSSKRAFDQFQLSKLKPGSSDAQGKGCLCLSESEQTQECPLHANRLYDSHKPFKSP